MERDTIYGLMEINIMEILLMVYKKGKVNIDGQKENKIKFLKGLINIVEIGLIIKDMVLVSIFGTIKINIMETGLKVKEQDRVYFNGIMVDKVEIHTLEIG